MARKLLVVIQLGGGNDGLVGDTVTWENHGDAWHNTRADGGAWSSPNLPPGQSFGHTSTAPGEYRYVCTLYQVEEMFGILDVLAAETPPTNRLVIPVVHR